MATLVTNDGEVIPPLNITAPAPTIDLRGFQWGTVDEKILAAEASHPEEAHAEAQVSTQQVASPPHLLQREVQHPPPPAASATPAAAAPAAAAKVPPAGPLPAPQLPLVPGDLPEQVESQLGFRPKPGEKPNAGPLFPLAQLQGTFAGNGFNSIFRPRPKDDGEAKNFKVAPQGPNDNILELNLTLEQWSFGKTIGDIPNRGLDGSVAGSVNQPDIHLTGFPYMQTVSDATDPSTGQRTNSNKTGIHFETGMWLNVPNCAANPVNKPTVVRMASIPHGTTINAQCLAPEQKVTPKTPLGGVAGPPKIDVLDTTPFSIGDVNAKFNGTFPSMNAEDNATFRLPQKLDKFREVGTITTEIIKNPNLVLEKAIENQKIIETITFEVSTGERNDTLNGGGITNISFLQGTQPAAEKDQNTGKFFERDVPNPNAHVPLMTSKFWIETVAYQVNVPLLTDSKPKLLSPVMPKGKDGKESTAPTPQFLITPPAKLPSQPKTITVPGIQVQYSQNVILNFVGISWPHVSCATLVPTGPQPFKMT